MAKSETGQWVNRWWLVLIHGLLLIVLSYLLMSHTDMFFEKLGRIISFLALLTGTMAILNSFLAGKHEKSPMDFWWGLVSCGTGIFFLFRRDIIEDWIQWLVLFYMVMNAINLFLISLQLSPQFRIWGYALFLVIYTLSIVYMFFTKGWLFDLPPLIFSGFQFFINGILLAVMAFGIRKIQREYTVKLSDLRNHSSELPHLFL